MKHTVHLPTTVNWKQKQQKQQKSKIVDCCLAGVGSCAFLQSVFQSRKQSDMVRSLYVVHPIIHPRMQSLPSFTGYPAVVPVCLCACHPPKTMTLCCAADANLVQGQRGNEMAGVFLQRLSDAVPGRSFGMCPGMSLYFCLFRVAFAEPPPERHRCLGCC